MFPDSILWRMAVAQLYQLTATIVVLGGLAALVARRHPHLAYALWLVVLVKAVTPPLWSSNLGVFGHSSWLTFQTALPPPATEIVRPMEQDKRSVLLPATDESSLLRQAGGASITGQSASVPAISPRNWLAAVWLAGSSGTLVLASLTVALRSRTLRQKSSQPGSTFIQDVRNLAGELGISRPFHVAITENNLGPALCGVWRPTILLPRCLLEEKSCAALRPILVHELVHLRRSDHLVAMLQCLAQIAWWFHPLVWFMNRAMVRTRERCCDLESVEALRCGPSQYARSLVEVLSARANLRPIYGLPGVRPLEVTMQRVKEIIAMKGQVFVRRKGWHLMAVLISAVIVLPGASFVPDTPVAAEQPAATAAAKPTSERSRVLLKYGDGQADGKKSIAGAGEMILFETPGETGMVRAVRVHGARYGYPQPPREDIEITLLTEDMTEVLHTELVPYSLFKRVSKNRWTHLPFRDPVEVPKKFWTVLNFNAEQTKGVYVSYDTSTKGAYSRVGLSEEDAKETDFAGDWMVQVLLAE